MGFKRNNSRYIVCVTCRNKLKFDRTNKRISVNTNNNDSVKYAEKCPVCLDGNNNPVSFSCGHKVCNECYDDMVAAAKKKWPR